MDQTNKAPSKAPTSVPQKRSRSGSTSGPEADVGPTPAPQRRPTRLANARVSYTWISYVPNDGDDQPDLPLVSVKPKRSRGAKGKRPVRQAAPTPPEENGTSEQDGSASIEDLDEQTAGPAPATEDGLPDGTCDSVDPLDDQINQLVQDAVDREGEVDEVGIVKDFFIDDQGLTRVGVQPRKLVAPVLSAPLDVARRFIHRRITENLSGTDAKLPGHDKAGIEKGKSSLKAELMAALDQVSQDRVKVRCQYTGTHMSWAPGLTSVSLEAIYHFVLEDGIFKYHARGNVGLITASLNIARRRHPPTLLPLGAAWLDAIEEPIFETRKSRLAWTFNALQNCATLGLLFSCHQPHKEQISTWSEWSVETLEECLHALRTGIRNATVNEFLARHGNVLRASRYTGWSATEWAPIYRTLLRIASRYGLSAEEFDFYCTIPSPSGSKIPVFYPFYILSRPQAQSVGWGWDHLRHFASEKLIAMREKCNKHAEAANLGERQVDSTVFMYWMAAHLCQKIGALKDEHQTASMDEIAFRILDRWGFPIVPWVGSAVRASLCNDQDHGIAMLFGIVARDGKPFDPVDDIDLARCTVTIDSQLTNMAMWNYAREQWDSIRTLLQKVPLHHAFWRVDPSMGQEDWTTSSCHDDIIPVPPRPEFDMYLVPIEGWLAEGSDGPFSCTDCNEKHPSVGDLIHHMRQLHGSGSGSDSRQEDADETALKAADEDGKESQ